MLYGDNFVKINNDTLKWLWIVPQKRKWYIVILSVFQAINGASGVLYALLMREVVDNATAHDFDKFWRYVIYIIMSMKRQARLTRTPKAGF